MAGLFRAFHFVEHHVGDLFRHIRPDSDDLVVTFAIRDRSVAVLLIHFYDFVLGVFDEVTLTRRHDEVIDRDRDARLRRVIEAQLFDVVEHGDRHLRPIAQVRIAHQLAQAFFLQESIDEGHAFRHVVIENHTADCGVEHVVLGVDDFRVNDRLFIVCRCHIDQRTAISQANG